MNPVPTLSNPGRLWARSSIGLACGLVVVLAGCASIAPSETTGEVPTDYRRTHPIAIEESLETMDIPVGLSSSRLTSSMRAGIGGFAQSFLASGSSVIAVVAPSGSPNQTVAATIAVEVEDVIRRAGVDAEAVEYRVYRAGAHETNAPIRIAFNRVLAHTAPCRPWPDQVAENGQNRLYHNFGCASQQNLAAIVANPLDLLYPRGMTPADAARRVTFLKSTARAKASPPISRAKRAATLPGGWGNERRPIAARRIRTA